MKICTFLAMIIALLLGYLFEKHACYTQIMKQCLEYGIILAKNADQLKLSSMEKMHRYSPKKIMNNMEAIKYKNGKLAIINQILLPFRTEFLEIKGSQDAWNAIKLMQVRGAPAIAIVGCLGIVVEIFDKNVEFVPKRNLFNELKNKLEFINSARPTAVNLTTAIHHLVNVLNEILSDESKNTMSMKQTFIRQVEDMLSSDIRHNRQIGEFGLEAIIKHLKIDQKVTILTHCNTGSLATAGYGTALGVIRSLYEKQLLGHVYFTETRPYMQGSRLTAYELHLDQIPSTLIADSMVAMLMEKKQIGAVIVGADRIAMNGDTANKIGTYQIAILAQFFKIPFFVAAPTATIDQSLLSGDLIVIEERPACELRTVAGQPITLEDINCWNPAFDITPNSLITAFIMENGVFWNDKDKKPTFIF